MTSSSRYEPLLLIGRGSTCEIWLGTLSGAEGFLKPIVLKRANVGVNEDLEEAQNILIAEAHLGASLNHPNIVHVYELVDLPEGVMLAMEYLPGLSLRSMVSSLWEQGAAVPWPIAARIVSDAARGLEYAHNARSAASEPLDIVHRDVCPDNLMVAEEGITKVVDFGIARSSMREATEGFLVKGNIGYLSPEQARGEPLDGRSDVFSLGVVLHELFNSGPLFERERPGKSLEALIAAPIPEVQSDVPVVARDLVRRMLVRERRGRSITMGEVADTLESVAATQCGNHRDVAAFLRAEFGPELDGRRQIVAQIFEQPSTVELMNAVVGEPSMTTLTALDAVFASGEWALGQAKRGWNDDADTIVDAKQPGTFIERPLLKPLSGSKK